MHKYRKTLAMAGLCVSLTTANTVLSAGAKTSANASVTIVSPVNVSAYAAAAYTQVLFKRSTGTLSIRIPGAPATRGLVQSACGWAMSGGGNNRCDAPLTLQVLNDGTLNGQQGVSLSFTRVSDVSRVVLAMLAYN
jgi:hypothetical protein